MVSAKKKQKKTPKGVDYCLESDDIDSAARRHFDGFAKRLAAPPANAYPHRMCRNITRDQQIEGWRAFVELLSGFKPGFKPRGVGVVAAALVARLQRFIYAGSARRV